MANLIAAGRQLWARLQTNPIVTYHLGKKRWLPLQWVVGMGAVGWLVCLLGVVMVGPPSLRPLDLDIAIIMFPGINAYVLLLLYGVIAGTLTQFVRREFKTHRYQMLCVTSLSNADIVWGYLVAGLYQARLYVATLLALSPGMSATLAVSGWGLYRGVFTSATLFPEFVYVQVALWVLGIPVVMLLSASGLLLMLIHALNLGLYLHQGTTFESVAMRLAISPGVLIWLFGWVGFAWPTIYVHLPLMLVLLVWPLGVGWGLLQLAGRNIRRLTVPRE